MNEAPKEGWVIDESLKILRVECDQNSRLYRCYDSKNNLKGMMWELGVEIYPTQILAEQARMDIMKVALTNYLNKNNEEQ